MATPTKNELLEQVAELRAALSAAQNARAEPALHPRQRALLDRIPVGFTPVQTFFHIKRTLGDEVLGTKVQDDGVWVWTNEARVFVRCP